jgi:erythritol transport system permease protein
MLEQLLRLRALIALAIVTLVFSWLSPEFLTVGNLSILVKHVAINAILAIGMTFVILSGGIDLSVGSVVGFCGMVAGLLLSRGLVLESLNVVVYPHAWFVIVLALLAGMGIGAANGVIVSRLGVAPFIATLGSMYVARGAALLLSDGATFPNLGGQASLGNVGFPWIGTAHVVGLPVPVSIMAILAVTAMLVASRTPFGRHVYAVGGNERAALLSGVRVSRVRLRVYVISGFCAALVGVIIAAQLGAAHPATGTTFELNAIAAVVLGGTSILGGRGSYLGTVAGAILITILASILSVMQIAEFGRQIIYGVIIVGMLLLYGRDKGMR